MGSVDAGCTASRSRDALGGMQARHCCRHDYMPENRDAPEQWQMRFATKTSLASSHETGDAFPE